MNKREVYLKYVDNRCETGTIFAPLVDEEFSTKYAGKQWYSDACVEDVIQASEEIGYIGGFVRDNFLSFPMNPALLGLQETKKVSDTGDRREFESVIRTPIGDLTNRFFETKGKRVDQEGDWLTDEEQLPIVNWISEDLISGNRDSLIVDFYRAFAEKTHPYGSTQIQLELPYFMYCLPGLSAGPLMMSLEGSTAHADSMALAQQALEHVAVLLVKAGIDFVWIGAGGTELLSPNVYESMIIPQSQGIIKKVKAAGGRVHYHCCGQSGVWIEKGYFNEISMDLLETLSAPPCGNIKDIGAARAAIDRRIVTRGNVDLNLILNGTPGQCVEATQNVINATKGYSHVVGAGDAILEGTPAENLKAMNEVVSQYFPEELPRD